MVCEKMKKKGSIVVAILLLAVGFAAVSTTLIINGSAKVSENTDDFSIIFTSASLDGTDVYASVIDDTKKIINFNTKDLKNVGDTSVLNYEVTNNSANYDAEVTVNCKVKDNAEAKYTSIKNELENNATVIKAKETLNGTLTVTLNKVATEEVREEYICTLEVNAVEREILGIRVVNLYDAIENMADTTTTINFDVRSGATGRETNGIYTTTATDGNIPVYYYRGAADKVNNNIIFGNFCWKIIRTTETGGIKLIYNGIPTDGKCNNTGDASQTDAITWNAKYNDNAYVGYMFGINNTGNSTSKKQAQTNTYASTMKTYLEDTWFENNLKDYVDYLEDTIFCNDRSTVAGGKNNIHPTSYGTLGYGTNATGYGAVARASYNTTTLKPSLVCPQDNDKFTVESANGNGKLKYPVGLITLDEVILAGYNSYASNSSDYRDTTNYLTTGNVFWTFSPIAMNLGSTANVGTCHSSGYPGNNPVDRVIAVRPVVSLKKDTDVLASGEGTIEKPYIVNS